MGLGQSGCTLELHAQQGNLALGCDAVHRRLGQPVEVAVDPRALQHVPVLHKRGKLLLRHKVVVAALLLAVRRRPRRVRQADERGEGVKRM